MKPVKAMRQAMHTHWRAAAWMLERSQPEQYGRSQKIGMGRRELRVLAQDLVNVVREEVFDPLLSERIEQRIQATVNYAMRHAWDRRRSGPQLRRAMEFFDRKDAQHPWSDPLAAAQEASYAMDDPDASDNYDQQEAQPTIDPAVAADVKEAVKQLVRLAKAPETEEERALRVKAENAAEEVADGPPEEETSAAGSCATASLSGSGCCVPGSHCRTSRTVAHGDVSTERNATMGDAEVRAAIRARLTELLAQGADQIEQLPRNVERNEMYGPKWEATFGTKKRVTNGGTERNVQGLVEASGEWLVGSGERIVSGDP